MRNREFVIEQYRRGKLVRTFTPSGDDVRPWRMNVGGKSYLRTSGWVLSKVLPTLVEGSQFTSIAIPVDSAGATDGNDGASNRGIQQTATR